MRSALQQFLRPETLVFVAAWLVASVAYHERGFYDPGALWHPVVGDLLLTDGLIFTDPFSYTFAGRTWIPQQWGAEVGMALLQRAGGRDLLLSGFCTLTAGLAAWLFVRLRNAGLHAALSTAFTGVVLSAGAFHFYVRPHMVTIVLTAVTTALLVDFDRRRVGPARLALLIPLFVFWTNLHGGVLGGILCFGVCLGGWTVQAVAGQGGPLRTGREFALVAAIFVTCALSPFVNPFGWEMIATWQRIVGSTVLKDCVGEHMPLDPTQTIDQVVLGFMLLVALGFAGLLPKLQSEFRATWLLPLVWAYFTLGGIRQGPLFAVVAAVVLADSWKASLWYALLQKYGDTFAHRDDTPPARPCWKCLVVPALLLSFVACLQVGGVQVPVVGAGWVRLGSPLSPTDLTEAIEAELATTGPAARVFNDANLGGYLISHHPARKIFMDDRYELYGDAWTREYVEMLRTRPERVEEYCDRFGCTHALVVVEPGEPAPLVAHMAGSPRWREVARNESCRFYRRLQITPPDAP